MIVKKKELPEGSVCRGCKDNAGIASGDREEAECLCIQLARLVSSGRKGFVCPAIKAVAA